MRQSLSERIRQNKNRYPFHMPGHKRNPFFLPDDLLSLDVTEYPGMDNLHAPNDVIRALQTDIAAFYGADESFLLVNGSSCGIIAAVCATCAPGDVLMTARSSHVSVYRALALSGAVPRYIMPERLPEGLTGGVLPKKMAEVLQSTSPPTSLRAETAFESSKSATHDGNAFSRAKAAILTSPTYEGFVSDVAGAADAIHASGGLLIVDEAHGAHFPFHQKFPASALMFGADIVVNSLHKTLPALSSCAVLHVKGPRVDRERLRFYLRALQTTSPSYMVMAAADHSLRFLWKNPSYFEAYLSRLVELRQALYDPKEARPIRLVSFKANELNAGGVCAVDIGKVLLGIHTDRDGEAVAEILSRRFGLQMEMAGAYHILAMTSVADTAEGFERLAEAVLLLNRELSTVEHEPEAMTVPPPEAVLTPAQAARCHTEVVDMEKAVGRIAADFIMRYPPGIPLLAPGERITRAHMEIIAREKSFADSLSVIC